MTQRPWENMSPQDIDKILPSAMRENNADYFLHELYRTARDIDIYGWRDALTPDALVRFGPATSFAPGMPYHYRLYKFERNYYCYQNGTVYLWNPYEMLPYRGIPVIRFTSEQDMVFRHAVQSLVVYHKNRGLYCEPIKMRETQSQKYPNAINCFNLGLKHYQEQNPLQTPVRCDGCERWCYLGCQVHPNPSWGDDKYPTINHIFANDCHGTCAAKMQEYLNNIQQKQK